MKNISFCFLILLTTTFFNSCYGQHISEIYLQTVSDQKDNIFRYYVCNDKHIILSKENNPFIGLYNRNGELENSFTIDSSNFIDVYYKVKSLYPLQEISLPEINNTNVGYYGMFEFISCNINGEYRLAWSILLNELNKETGEYELGPFTVITHLDMDFKVLNHYTIKPVHKNFVDNNKTWDSFILTWGSYIFPDVIILSRVVNPFTKGDKLYSEYKFDKSKGYQFHKYSNYAFDSYLEDFFKDLSWRSGSQDYSLNIFEMKQKKYILNQFFKIYDYENIKFIADLSVSKSIINDVIITKDIKYNHTSNNICSCSKTKKRDNHYNMLLTKFNIDSSISNELLYPLEIGANFINCSIDNDKFYILRKTNNKYKISAIEISLN